MAKKQDKKITGKQINYKKLTLVFSAALVILVGLGLILSYLNFYPPFIDKKIIYSLDSFVADIPLLPKTPKQIVTKAFGQASNLNSYSIKVNGSVLAGKAEIIGLSVSGAIEKAGLLTSRAELQTKVALAGQGEADFKTIEENNNLYLQIVKATPLPGFDFSTVANSKWYKVDLGSFQKNLGASIRSDKDILKDVSAEFEKIRVGVIASQSFPTTKEFKQGKVGSDTFYQIKLDLSNRKIKDTFLGSDFDTKNTTLDLQINKRTYNLTSITLETNAIGNGLDRSAEPLTAQINYQISNINQKQVIDSIETDKIIQNPLDLYSLLYPNQGSSAQDILDTTKAIPDLGSNFLTLERLLKVVLLIPKAL